MVDRENYGTKGGGTIEMAQSSLISKAFASSLPY